MRGLRHICRTILDDDNRHDHAVDTQDTSHNDWHGRLDDEFWLEDTHRADSDTGLCASIGSSQVCVPKGLLAKTRAEATPM